MNVSNRNEDQNKDYITARNVFKKRKELYNSIDYSKFHCDTPPEVIGFFAGTTCNSNCLMCWTRKTIYDFDDLPFEYIEQIVKETGGLPQYFKFRAFGEPLLYPHVQKLIDITKKNYMYLSITTNGSLIKNFLEIAKIGGNIIFSIDGATKETYETIRRGLKYETVISGVKEFIKTWRDECNRLNKAWEKNYPNPVNRFININYCVLKNNQHEIFDMVKLAEELGVHSIVFVRGIMLHLTDAKGLEIDRNDSTIRDQIERAKKECQNIIIHDRCTQQNICVTPKHEGVACTEPWKRIDLRPNGDIYPCCQAGAEIKLGNIEEGFMNVWNSDIAQELRKRIYTKTITKEFSPKCANCLSGII